MPLDWLPFVELVQRHQRFLIMTHVRPDGDALGSELAPGCICVNMARRFALSRRPTSRRAIDFSIPQVPGSKGSSHPARLPRYRCHHHCRYGNMEPTGRFRRVHEVDERAESRHRPSSHAGRSRRDAVRRYSRESGWPIGLRCVSGIGQPLSCETARHCFWRWPPIQAGFITPTPRPRLRTGRRIDPGRCRASSHL